MIYIKKNYLFLIILISLFSACKNSPIKVKKYEYYKSGELKRVGFFLRDSIPIDTIRNYYENGRIKSIEIRDDSGLLNGISFIFYQSGEIKQLQPYMNGVEQGFASSFSQDEKIQTKEYYFKGFRVGDTYFFDTLSGNIYAYRFKDFNGKSLLQIDYNGDQSIKQENHQALFIDSITLHSNKKQKIRNEQTCKILLIVSNPPKCHTTISISFWDNAKAYKTDTIPDGEFYLDTKQIMYNTDSIIVFAKQYDSLNQKESYHKSVTPINN